MEEFRYIGKPVSRVDAYDKVTGAAVFGADIRQQGELYGAVYRSPYPHARILSIDTSAAKKAPGVRAVVTGKDRPILYGVPIADEPFLAFDKVRYYGEAVAAVAADTLEQAEEAVKLITAEYEELPVVDDVLEAVKPGSPTVHDSWQSYKKTGKVGCVEGGNICDVFKVRKGDVDQGFAQADVIVEKQYNTALIQHVTIETHCATVLVDHKGGITCWTSAQSPFMIRQYFASTLNLAYNDVRVIGTYVGGGFGSKFDLRAEQIAYMLAYELKGRPVKVVFDRTEDFIASVVRGKVVTNIKTGATKDGKIVAQQIEIYWDTGAYTTMGPRVATNGAIAASGPYEIPNVKIDSYCVATNKPICGAYRGFGVPETNWAGENQLNVLAEKLGIDPLELRKRNAYREGSISVTGEKLFSVGVYDSLVKAGEMIDWQSSGLRGTTSTGKLWGRGVACFLKMTSSPSSTSVVVQFNEDATCVINMGGSEMGQGSHTVVCQIVAEEMGLPIEKVRMAGNIDTYYTPFDKTTSSSRFTFMMGNALIMACNDLKEQLIERASGSWKTPKENIAIGQGLIKEITGEGRSAVIAELDKSTLKKELPPLIGKGAFSTVYDITPADPETAQSPRPTTFWIYGTQAAEIEVDTETGEVDVVKFVAAHDCGKALNPHTCIQQIEGAIVMGLGHALREELIYENGIPRNSNMVDFKIPTVRDFPTKADIAFVDAPHREGPYGAKGVGETALTATCAAIGGAVSNAVQHTFNQIPIKAEQILEVIEAQNP